MVRKYSDSDGEAESGIIIINTHSTVNCLLNYLCMRLWGKSRDGFYRFLIGRGTHGILFTNYKPTMNHDLPRNVQFGRAQLWGTTQQTI